MGTVKKQITWGLVVFLSLSTFSSAEENEKKKESKTKTVAHGILSDLASPVTTQARWILLGGAVATTMAFVTRKNVEYRRAQSFGEAKPLGNLGFLGHTVGFGMLNATYSLGMLFYGMNQEDQKSLRAAEHMMRSSVYTLGLTLAMKNVVSERRPGYPEDDQSFPSGHSSASFAFASVVAAQHGWAWGGVAHAFAGFIALSRINDDFHFLHDVLAGITIGASYGWGVYDSLEEGSPYWFSLVPVPKGAALAIGFDF